MLTRQHWCRKQETRIIYTPYWLYNSQNSMFIYFLTPLEHSIMIGLKNTLLWPWQGLVPASEQRHFLGNYGIFHSLEWLVFLSSIWRVLFPGLPNAYGIQRQSDEISYQGCSSYRTNINLRAAGWPLWVQTVCIYKIIAEVIYPRTNSTVQKHKRNIIRPHQQS